MNCPFCASQARDLHAIVEHVAIHHCEKPKTLALLIGIVADDVPPTPGLRLPVFECDLDAIYLKRPDLVGRKAAP